MHFHPQRSIMPLLAGTLALIAVLGMASWFLRCPLFGMCPPQPRTGPLRDSDYPIRFLPSLQCGERAQFGQTLRVAGNRVVWRHNFRGTTYTWNGTIDSDGNIWATTQLPGTLATGLYLDVNMYYPQCGPIRGGVGGMGRLRERPPPGPTPQPFTLPEFPWPPPAASSFYVLPKSIFGRHTRIGQLVDAIISALESAGYVERSFFRAEGNGITLVTRLERINDDGSPWPGSERWPTRGRQGDTATDLLGFLRGLFYADPGRYRVIVFIIQDTPFFQSAEKVTGEEARSWLRSGANTLPSEASEQPLGLSNCTALIYEFASDGTAVRVVESRLTGRQHLEKSGLMAFLERPN
jgi:hypothetical protein